MPRLRQGQEQGHGHRRILGTSWHQAFESPGAGAGPLSPCVLRPPFEFLSAGVCSFKGWRGLPRLFIENLVTCTSPLSSSAPVPAAQGFSKGRRGSQAPSRFIALPQGRSRGLSGSLVSTDTFPSPFASRPSQRARDRQTYPSNRPIRLQLYTTLNQEGYANRIRFLVP